MPNMITIRSYNPLFSNNLADIFYEAVHAIADEVYSQEQKNEWAKKPIIYDKWKLRFHDKKPYIAFYYNTPCGFIELDDSGYIDCFYVKPNYQGLGVGNTLYSYIESIAVNKGLEQLWVDASTIAKAFFIKRGYLQQKKNLIKRNQVTLVNYSLVKLL